MLFKRSREAGGGESTSHERKCIKKLRKLGEHLLKVLYYYN